MTLLGADAERRFARKVLDGGLFHFDPDGKIKTENSGPEAHFVDFASPLVNTNYAFFEELCKETAVAIEARGLDEPAISGIPQVANLAAYRIASSLQRPYVPMPEIPGFDKHNNYSRYLLIDDVSGSGITLQSTIHKLRGSGWPIHRVVTFYDKSLGAADKMMGLGIELHSMLSFEVLLSVAQDQGRLDEAGAQLVRDRHEKIYAELNSTDYPGGKSALEHDARVSGLSTASILDGYRLHRRNQVLAASSAHGH